MSWIQLHVQTDAEHAEIIADQLHEFGAASVTFQDSKDQPLFEPPLGTTPLWQHTTVTGLFDDTIDVTACLQQLKTALPQLSLTSQIEALEEKNWERAWMDDFQPMPFGERLWIVPSWHAAPDPEAANIELDPGLAFGTGTHPTTALCLRWLDAHPPERITAIDYGCGSGILAIAALKLGASEVHAIDNDPQALLASNDNAERNRVDNRLHTYLPTELADDLKVPLLLANILANPLIELAPRLAEHVITGGHIVLSGILAEQEDEVLAAYLPFFDMPGRWQEDSWLCLEGVKK